MPASAAASAIAAGWGVITPSPYTGGAAPAKICVQFVVNYEEGGENAIIHGDKASEAFLSEIVGDKLLYHGSATREGEHKGERITTLLDTGKLFTDLGVPPIDPATDRAMICGSMEMLKETAALCERFGLEEGANSKPGTYVVERSFVD